jgi:hypothetical protein
MAAEYDEDSMSDVPGFLPDLEEGLRVLRQSMAKGGSRD